MFDLTDFEVGDEFILSPFEMGRVISAIVAEGGTFEFVNDPQQLGQSLVITSLPNRKKTAKGEKVPETVIETIEDIEIEPEPPQELAPELDVEPEPQPNQPTPDKDPEAAVPDPNTPNPEPEIETSAPVSKPKGRPRKVIPSNNPKFPRR